jgi:hypothetical protein
MLACGCAALAMQARPAAAPAATDAHNISGLWLGLLGVAYQPQFRSVDGSDAPLTPAARAEFQRHRVASEAGKPYPDTPSRCLPHGVPRSMLTPYPMHIVQTPGQITIVHESGHNIRLIYMDEEQPTTVPLTYMGHSVGRWEGDTLVIDTVGLNAETWLDEAAQPHGERLHVVEHMRKLADGRLEDLITLSDPDMFEHSWTARRVYDPRPDLTLLEYICEENARDLAKELGAMQ